MRRIAAKVMLLGLLLSCSCFSADIAFALGGGGHNGDGRSDYLQPAAPAAGPAPQQTSSGSFESVMLSSQLVQQTVTVPEPVLVLLLGLGLVGLAGVRRRLTQ